jgi:hypothetical protein
MIQRVYNTMSWIQLQWQPSCLCAPQLHTLLIKDEKREKEDSVVLVIPKDMRSSIFKTGHRGKVAIRGVDSSWADSLPNSPDLSMV